MAFAQVTYRESLRYIEACLRAQQGKLLPHGDQGASLYTILQVLSVSAFEGTLLFQQLAQPDYKSEPDGNNN